MRLEDLSMNDTRPELRLFVDELLKKEGPITLDVVAEVIGSAPVTPEDIGIVIDAVERNGREVDAERPPSPRQMLKEVLVSARALSTELRRVPSVGEIADRSGLNPESVRLALRFARVMTR